MKTIIHKIKKFKFEKVHYFDLGVIFFILITISVLLFNKFSKKVSWIDARVLISNGEWWWKGDPPQFWLIDNLEPGLVSYNSFGEKVAEIKDVDFYSSGGPYRTAYVDLKIKVSYDKKRELFLYNFQPIQVGKPIDLTFSSNNLSGLIVSLGAENEEKVVKKIRVKMEHLEGWLANSYKEGMEMKNSKGEVLAKIENIEIKRSKLNNIKVVDEKVYYSTDNFFDVYLEILLSSYLDSSGSYRFVDGSSIKIGEDIWFHFPTIVAKTIITEIIE